MEFRTKAPQISIYKKGGPYEIAATSYPAQPLTRGEFIYTIKTLFSPLLFALESY